MKSCESWEVRAGEPLTKSPHGPGRLMASLASAVFKMRTVKWQRRRRREQEETNKAKKKSNRDGVLQISNNLDLTYSTRENKNVLKNTLNATE